FHLAVYAQRSDATLAAPVLYATAGSYSQRPSSVALGDLNGDGRLDVVVGLDRYGIEVFFGQADGTLGNPTFIATTDSTRIAVGHLDGDGAADVAGVGWGSNTVSTFDGGANGLTLAATYSVMHGGYEDIAVGDVTGDGRDDIVVMSGQLYADPNISVVPQLAAGGFGPAAGYSVGTNILTSGIGLGDVTGDGRTDVVASYGGNRPASNIAVFAQTSGGVLAAPVSYPSYDIPQPVAVADLDADGRPDVITVHGGWQAVGVYRGQAGGTLGVEDLYPVPYASNYNPQGLAIGDVNGDHAPDVVIADPNNGLVVLLNAHAPTVPSAPTLTNAVPGNGQMTLGWAAPASSGGAPISSYTATATPGGATCSTSGLTCTITGLVNGTSYSFTVSATNVVGTGPPSNSLSSTPATVPAAPRSLTAVAGKAGITVGWAAPPSNGGSAITAYRVYRGTVAGGAKVLVATVGAGALSWLDTSAAHRTRYYYVITAVNARGESPPSLEVNAVAR
ncbi:MAG TPA: FG-GAP-like repeat-containing protein, partial [Candidatus Binatus sp.]|nr:FG-GAP-like repeat-containing protein [Candidatus Binatus sp.]